MITAELNLFDIHTSEEDIRTKISSLNPYPYKLFNGDLLVSIKYYPTSNPQVCIKYTSTGEMYYVNVPLAYAINEFEAPIQIRYLTDSSLLDQHKKEPIWQTLHNYVVDLALTFVETEMDNLAQYEAATKHALVKRYEHGIPQFYPPDSGYVRVVQEALQRIQEGDLATGYLFLEYALLTGAYEIDGVEYPNRVVDISTYADGALALVICPSIVYDYAEEIALAKLNRTSSPIYETAKEITVFIDLCIEIQALELAVGKYEGVAQLHINRVLDLMRRRKAEFTDKLTRRYDTKRKETYLHKVIAYFEAHDVRLPM